MTAQFYDLSITKLDDGTIRLEQRIDYEDNAIIDLHPAQAAYIADGMPANPSERIQTQPNWLTERIATLERRMLWMRDRFDECHAALPSDMHERCAEAFEFDAWLMASVDVATEFCADFPDAPSDAFASPVEAPSLPPSDGSLPSATGCAAGHSEHHSRGLFSNATGKD